MAVSRPFLLAVIGIALLGATVLAVQNAREAGDDAAGMAAGQGQPAAASSRSEPAPAPEEAIEADNPRLLKRALRQQRKAVLFLANPRGLDDQMVERSVRAVERDTGAVVLSDLVAGVDRYGSLVEDLGVTQTPAVVVIDTRGEARLVEGYVDAASLVQVVTDAR